MTFSPNSTLAIGNSVVALHSGESLHPLDCVDGVFAVTFIVLLNYLCLPMALEAKERNDAPTLPVSGRKGVGLAANQKAETL